MNEADQLANDESSRFEQRVVKAVRGREASTKAKMQNQGWEFVSHSTGTLRTELTFRRPRPKSLAAHLGAAWAAFRTLPPKVQAGIGGAAGIALVALVVAVAVSSNGGQDTTPTAGTPPVTVSSRSGIPSTSVNSEPTSSNPASASATSPSTSPGADQPITVKDNPELAKLLSSDQDDALAAAFAERYADRTIEFDGNLGAMMHHGDKKTRYDMLILAGDYDENKSTGPYFKFVDVSPVLDLHPTAKNSPDTIRVGDNLHVVAKVGEFNEMAGNWELEPIHVDHR